MERYCVIAPARTGTTVVSQAIEIYFNKKYNEYFTFGEIQNLRSCEYRLNINDKVIDKSNGSFFYDSSEYIQNLTNINNYIINTKIPIVGKYIPYIWQLKYFNNIDYCKFFIENGFTLVTINRNFQETFFSTVVSSVRKYYHTNKNQSQENVEPITLDFRSCIEALQTVKSCYFLSKIIRQKYVTRVLNYDTLYDDLNHMFSITKDELFTTTTYPIPYSELIKNYNEVVNWVKEYNIEQ
jgi:hypothetical protein